MLSDGHLCGVGESMDVRHLHVELRNLRGGNTPWSDKLLLVIVSAVPHAFANALRVI